MIGKITQLEIPLDCYKNGKADIFPTNEAYKRFRDSNYGWLCPSDWYSFSIEGYSGQNYIYKIIGKKAMRFGFLVHAREGPLTIDDAESLLNDGYELEVNTFISWASKFNRIFRKPYVSKELPMELRPFYYLEVPNGIGNITRPAYKMHPERTSFVIVGVDPTSQYSNTDVDWTIFQAPPDHS
jgi:hypothetical protein